MPQRGSVRGGTRTRLHMRLCGGVEGTLLQYRSWRMRKLPMFERRHLHWQIGSICVCLCCGIYRPELWGRHSSMQRLAVQEQRTLPYGRRSARLLLRPRLPWREMWISVRRVSDWAKVKFWNSNFKFCLLINILLQMLEWRTMRWWHRRFFVRLPQRLQRNVLRVHANPNRRSRLQLHDVRRSEVHNDAKNWNVDRLDVYVEHHHEFNNHTIGGWRGFNSIANGLAFRVHVNNHTVSANHIYWWLLLLDARSSWLKQNHGTSDRHQRPRIIHTIIVNSVNGSWIFDGSFTNFIDDVNRKFVKLRRLIVVHINSHNATNNLKDNQISTLPARCNTHHNFHQSFRVDHWTNGVGIDVDISKRHRQF